MRNDVHMRDGVAILLLLLMMALITLPLKRDRIQSTTSPSTAVAYKK